VQGFETVPGLLELVEHVGLAPASAADGVRAAASELVLEALVAQKRVARTSSGGYARARHDPPKNKGFGGFDPFAG
jgi:magnesium chelatase subunit I